MENNGKKNGLLITIVICVLIGIIGFAIYWSSTEDIRIRDDMIADIKDEIAAYRSRESFMISFIVIDGVKDQIFEDFLVTQVQEMCQNREISLLIEFLQELEFEKCYYESIVQVVNDWLVSLGDIEAAFDVVAKMDIPLDYYKAELKLNRTSGLIGEYIGKNGTKPITFTPGEGYYANEQDSTSKDVVGLPDSPLYDAEEETHFGDFMLVHEYGVTLNAYYEETYYSREKFYFRDTALLFSPYDGECVWSGDYLFCFDSSGLLIGFSKI